MFILHIFLVIICEYIEIKKSRYIGMLQKIKYETLNYGRFEKMRKKFLSPDFEPEECKELELSH